MRVYNAIAAVNGLTHLGCWAHARRYFIEAEAVIPKAACGPEQPATQFIAAIGELYAIEQEAKAKTTSPPVGSSAWRAVGRCWQESKRCWCAICTA